ncbi:MAG: amidohydrolase family protein [Burkholderiales bacterium]
MTNVDILIEGGSVVTMDPARRVLENASVAIAGQRIVAVGPADELQRDYQAAKTIDARRKVVMPGLVDCHAHAGASLIKQVAEHFPGAEWRNIFDFISYQTSKDWWYLDSVFSALEKLKFGTTTSLYMLGCAPRSDNPEYAYANAAGVERVGIRSIIGVGPSRPPYPRDYTYWENGRRIEKAVTFEESVAKMQETIGTWKAKHHPTVQMWATASRLMNENPFDPVYDPGNAKYVQPQADALQQVMQDYDVGFHLHGYGTAVEFMKERAPALLGPKTVIGHGWPLSLDTVGILADTKTRVAHCPRAQRIYLNKGRCPVPELVEAGVIVGFGSDFVGMDRSWNLWEDIYWSPRIHRRLKNDPTVMPIGKVLEMATIDGAKALGLDDQIGSIEVGKDADIIVINTWKPHIVPLLGSMTTQRLAYFTRGEDVETAIVRGRVLMEDRKVLTVDEDEILEWVDAEARHTVRVFGLEPMMQRNVNYWNASRH